MCASAALIKNYVGNSHDNYEENIEAKIIGGIDGQRQLSSVRKNVE